MKHKLIMENWKNFMKQNILNEAAYGISDIGAAIVEIERDGNDYIAIALKDNNREYGFIGLAPLEMCSPGPVWKVSEVEADDGWGPFLYDLAIEEASSMGGQGLVPDIEISLSLDAIKIWEFYYDNRLSEFRTESIFERCDLPREGLRIRGRYKGLNAAERIPEDHDLFKKVTLRYRAKNFHIKKFLRNNNKYIKL